MNKGAPSVQEKIQTVLPQYLARIGGDEKKLKWIEEQMILQLTKQFTKVVLTMTVEDYVKQMIDYYVFAAHLVVK